MKLEDLKVLIIDDDESLCLILEKNLMNLGVYDIRKAHNAEKGVALTAEHHPHILFLDDQLPDIKGTDLIKILKEVSSDTSILTISQEIDLNTVAKSVQKGAEYCVDKNHLDKNFIRKILETKIKADKENSSFWKIFDFLSVKDNANKRKNIFVLEDDEMFSFHLNYLLSKLPANHNICSFTKGGDLLEFMKKCKPDVAFLDYYLPECTGLEILEKIRLEYSDTKVVIVSGQEDPEIAMNLANHGLSGYIIKDKNMKANLDEVVQKLDL